MPSVRYNWYHHQQVGPDNVKKRKKYHWPLLWRFHRPWAGASFLLHSGISRWHIFSFKCFLETISFVMIILVWLHLKYFTKIIGGLWQKQNKTLTYMLTLWRTRMRVNTFFKKIHPCNHTDIHFFPYHKYWIIRENRQKKTSSSLFYIRSMTIVV